MSITPEIVETESDEVRIDVTVEVSIYDGRDIPRYALLRYDDVMLCLYASDGEVLFSENLGTIATGFNATFQERYHVSTTVDSVPKYILVDHPALRDDQGPTSPVRVWDPETGLYWERHEHLDEIQNRFEYPRISEPGRCG